MNETGDVGKQRIINALTRQAEVNSENRNGETENKYSTLHY